MSEVNPSSRQAERVEASGVDHSKGRKHLLFSVVLHLAVVAIFGFSWSFSAPPEVVVPKYLEARVATEADLAPLRAKKEEAEQEAIRKAQEQARRAEKKRVEERRQQAIRKQRKEEAERKKAAEKKAAERKKALIEKEKREKEARRKAEQEKKKRAEELARQREEEKRLAAEKKAQEQRKAREDALAERLALAEQEAQARAEADAKRAALSALEASETERYLGYIKSRIENRWHKPPNVAGLTVTLEIRLLPSGELAGVSIKKKSGNAALDQSAMTAVRSVKRFPVPESSAIFEKNFRSFVMRFTP